MNSTPEHFASLSCDLRIIRAKNTALIKLSSKSLFIRYYLSAGNNERIQLNSREIAWSETFQEPSWDESFSLECSGNEHSMPRLKQETVVYELRCRNTTKSIFGNKSYLLGRVEVPWKIVLGSHDMEIEQWFTMKSGSRVFEGVKPPAIQVEMKVRVHDTMATAEKRRRNGRLLKRWDECGCKDGGCKCVDDHIFALAALMAI